MTISASLDTQQSCIVTPLAISPAVLPCASHAPCRPLPGSTLSCRRTVRTSLTPSIDRRFAMCLSISDRSKALLSRDSAPIRVKRRECRFDVDHVVDCSTSDASTIRGSSWRSRPRAVGASSGPSARRGGITKAGNPACTATTGRSGMGLSGATADRTMLYRQEASPLKPICDIAWKAQLRLPAACAAWWRAARRSRKSLRRLRRAQGIHRGKVAARWRTPRKRYGHQHHRYVRA